MKHIAKPPMPSTEDFLELLSDPVLFAAKVREFRDAVETLDARIDVATTLDDAQRLKLRAEASRDELADRARILAVDRAALAQAQTRLAAETEAHATMMAEQEAAQRVHRQAFESERATVAQASEARQAEVTAREHALTERERVLTLREQAVQQAELAWKEKFAQLSAILESS